MGTQARKLERTGVGVIRPCRCLQMSARVVHGTVEVGWVGVEGGWFAASAHDGPRAGQDGRLREEEEEEGKGGSDMDPWTRGNEMGKNSTC